MATLISQYDLAWTLWAKRTSERLQVRRHTALHIYQSIWGAFAHWAIANELTPTEITPAQLTKYLQERELSHGMSPRHAWRFLRLLERVLPLYAQHTGTTLNTAPTQLLEQRPELRYANASRFDELPDTLQPKQAAALVRTLVDATNDIPTTWQVHRNAAVVALHLASGITPQEARTMTNDQVERAPENAPHTRTTTSFVVHLPPQPKIPARRIALPTWASRVLQAWIRDRDALAIPGNMLFPSTKLTGRPWGKVSHYNAVKEFLCASGVNAPDSSAYTLRHTYALRQLRRGIEPHRVAAALGVTDPDVLERYARLQAVLTDPAVLER